MSIDILIPTSAYKWYLQKLLECFSFQSLLPDHIIILIHVKLDEKVYTSLYVRMMSILWEDYTDRLHIISNVHHDYIPWRGVWYDRNILLQQAKSEYVYMIDHDNQFAPDFLEKTIQQRRSITQELWKDCVLSPTIMQWMTWNIQSQGITWFSFAFPKLRFGRIASSIWWQEVKMIGANSLFGKCETFLNFPFNIRFTRCGEDVDVTYAMHRAGVPIVCSAVVHIYHMERQKNKLQQIFLWDEYTAFERSRNRILFVKKYGTLWQKIQYFGVGLWIQTVWFIVLILLHGKEKRIALLRSVIYWMYKWMCPGV